MVETSRLYKKSWAYLKGSLGLFGLLQDSEGCVLLYDDPGMCTLPRNGQRSPYPKGEVSSSSFRIWLLNSKCCFSFWNHNLLLYAAASAAPPAGSSPSHWFTCTRCCS